MRSVIAVKNTRGYRMTITQDQPDIVSGMYSYAPMMTSKPTYTLDGLRVTARQAEALLSQQQYRGCPSITSSYGYYGGSPLDDPVLQIDGLEITEAEARAIAVEGNDPVTLLCGGRNGIALVFRTDWGGQ